jgi:hypothetical protein
MFNDTLRMMTLTGKGRQRREPRLPDCRMGTALRAEYYDGEQRVESGVNNL